MGLGCGCDAGVCLFKTQMDGAPDVLIMLMLNQCSGVCSRVPGGPRELFSVNYPNV